jgi:chemotaxis protein methyltransferase CheR
MTGRPKPKSVLLPDELKFVEDLLHRVSGITLSPAAGVDLELCFLNASQSQENSPALFLRRLRMKDPPAVACLVDYCVIGETYFFRHPEHFEFLKAVLEPCSREGRRPIALWSAGCATGEEVYSIAMALDQLGVPKERTTLIATDISKGALRRAKQGDYPPWSFRRMPADSSQYFEGKNSTRVKKEIRERVNFMHHNLVNDPIPTSTYQVIFCRNVLIYFTPQTAMSVIDKLAGALVPGGHLVLGLPEVPLARESGLELLRVQGAAVLRKPVPGALPVTEEKAPAEAKRSAPLMRVEPASLPTSASKRPAAPIKRVAPALAEPAGDPAPPKSPRFLEAIRLAQQGDLGQAEELAFSVAKAEKLPVAFLLQSICLAERGELDGAIQAVERALYLSPSMAMAHAELVSLFRRSGRPKDAERARRNALRALEGLSDDAPVEAVEPITAGALKRALKQLDCT